MLIMNFMNIRTQNKVLILKCLKTRIHEKLLILKCMNIKIQKQLLIRKCYLQYLGMMETRIRHRIVLVQWIKRSKILIKIHGGPSTSQLMHLILERLNYLPNILMINVKSVKIKHKTFHLISSRILKISPYKKVYIHRWL